MLKKNQNRETLTNKLYKNLGFSKSISNTLVYDIFNEIIIALESSNIVKIASFGTFKVLNKKERTGRNPKTKEEAKITARKVVVFKASKKLKNKLNIQ